MSVAPVGLRTSEIVWAGWRVLWEAIGLDKHPAVRDGSARDIRDPYDRLYPARGIVLEQRLVVRRDRKRNPIAGEVTVDFVHLCKPDAKGRHPVLRHWQPEDSPGEIVIVAPSFDVWIARRTGKIHGKVGARAFGLPTEHARSLRAHAERNFAGCWGHGFDDLVRKHEIGNGLCEPLRR